MNQFIAWLSMGGHAQYVWSAYGLVGIVLMVNCVASQRKKKQTCRTLNQWFKR